jgi:hypothetical protein
MLKPETMLADFGWSLPQRKMPRKENVPGTSHPAEKKKNRIAFGRQERKEF